MSRYLSKDRINKGRQPEVDCLKALAIFLMLIVHAYENNSEELGVVFDIFHIGMTLTGAAVFMACMGLGMRYSRCQTPVSLLQRGFELMTVGQLLNIVRDSIPTLIFYWITGEQVYIANVLVIQTDILTFAGFAFMLTALLFYLKLSSRAILTVGFVMNAAAFFVSRVFRTTGNYALDQLIGFFLVTDAEAYFPLCSYYVFVAFGLALGDVYQRISDKDGLSTRVLQIGLPVAAVYYALRFSVPLPLLPTYNTTEQYILNPLTDAMVNCLMAVNYLALFHKLLRRRGGKVPKLAAHLSRHINSYYCLSYVFYTPLSTIMWWKWGHQLPTVWLPFLYGLFVMFLCYLIIEWNNRTLKFGVAQIHGRSRVIVYSIIWILTVVIAIYIYPRTEVFGTVWNNYLM